MVGALGARVVQLVRDSLVPVLTGMEGVAEILAFGQDLSPVDAHCSLMSLPRAFRTELGTILSGIPYARAPDDRSLAWGRRLGSADGRRRVALAWSGSRAAWNRAIGLEALAPLLARDDCVFHVAQTEVRDRERAAMPAFPDLIDHNAELVDFADTAALLGHMDLVLTVDTVLAHLVGAMGRPVWTVLAYGADYRWRTEGEATPLYPSMRLFRQPAFDGGARWWPPLGARWTRTAHEFLCRSADPVGAPIVLGCRLARSDGHAAARGGRGWIDRFRALFPRASSLPDG